MNGMNISLDEANAWINKVEAEIDTVNTVLKEATECVNDFQEKDDSVYQELSKASEAYKSAWGKLESGYRDVFEGLRHAFKAQIEAVENAVEEIKRVAKNAKS